MLQPHLQSPQYLIFYLTFDLYVTSIAILSKMKVCGGGGGGGSGGGGRDKIAGTFDGFDVQSSPTNSVDPGVPPRF